ncbi:ABC transporter substrate-binding protein [Variovorax fucosicus]|uniref:ABC transporter substrate-binding protein n=1 Tax=Variovorax fucosicus TaxID=3053517 RepID=UPI00257903CE|nr:ABC transporter substrate-binding protein [Variovorax sp. J22G47]MDM0057668.1 ABC transporter substrate-binding protein [Variovorax sp. J22G47]
MPFLLPACALRRLLFSLAAAALFAGPLAASAQSPVRGGTLVVVSNPGEPAVLTAAFNQQGAVAAISTKIFDGLVRFGENFKLEPELATSWDVSKDGKEMRFKLRPNVRWHDGKPFTSADVKFTFEEVWLKVHPRARSTFAAVESIETPDPLTVVLKLRNPSGVILSALNSAESQILPKHLYEGTDIVRNPWNAKPVGTGPFRFKEWVRGDRIVLERNPDYWDAGKPYLDQVVYRTIPDATARYAAFETGAVQYGVLSPISINDLERAQKNKNLQVEFRGYEWLASSNVLEFNVRKPPFNDVRVRRAVAHAIDLQAMSKVTARGFAKPGTSPVLSTQTRFFTSDLPIYPFDVKQADRLLDQAGLPRKGDGVRFAVTLDWLPFGETFLRYGEFVKQSLRRVGIDVTIRGQDLPQFMRRVYSQNDFDLIVTHRAGFGDPQIGTDRLYWSKTILKDVPWSNGSGYSSPAMDGLIEAAHEAPTEDRRIELYKKVQRQAQTDIPNFTLLENRMYTIASARVRGLSTGSDGSYESLKNVWLAPAP